MTGRARGRGTAKAAPLKPGAAGDQAAANRAPVAAAAGRSSQRGGARADPRPGTAGVADLPVTQMREMSLGTQPAERSRRQMSFANPHTRPAHITDKTGTDGNPIQLVTNYYKLNTAPGWFLYQYHVDFSPIVESKKLRKGLLSEHKAKFSVYLFDGMQLYSATKLPDEVTEVFSIRKYDEQKIRITIKRTAELAPQSPQCLQIFNVMMRQMLEDVGMKEVQRAYYSQKNAIQLQRHNLEIWPGYKTSILQYEESVLLNVEVSHKVLRTESVLDFMYKLYGRVRSGFQDACLKQLIGEIILTRYNDKTYRITDIEWNVHPSNKFKRKDEEISYNEYYKSMYGIEVRDQDQPMLVSQSKRKDQREGAPEILYLLPELCVMTGLTEEMRADFGVMKDLGQHTRILPKPRAETCEKLMKMMLSTPAAAARLTGWNLQFGKELLNLTGRVLRPEQIILGSRRVTAGPQANWDNALKGAAMYSSVHLDDWSLIFSSRNRAQSDSLLSTLKEVGPPLGLRISAPSMVTVDNDSTSAYLNAIKSQIKPTTKLVMVLLSSNKKDRYDAVKKQCCVETPVSSQVVNAMTLQRAKNQMSIVTKIAIQVNCKLGGEAWALEIPLKKTMVVGFDTYHDSAKKGRSVGGFVASLNDTFTRYYSQTTMQAAHQELAQGLKASMQGALKKFHAINGYVPERIIIYRDGVGDGQLPAVVETELPQINDAFKQIGEAYHPKLTVIVVKKRISSRFFAKTGRELSNPGPGTVVDSVVTRPESYDFFLVPQSVRQGTVTPVHYNVIKDNSGLKPDHIQRLTYKLCHLYYNWAGTVRVPAPCQYAHKLAFLVGQSVHQMPSDALADKLYYL